MLPLLQSGLYLNSRHSTEATLAKIFDNALLTVDSTAKETWKCKFCTGLYIKNWHYPVPMQYSLLALVFNRFDYRVITTVISYHPVNVTVMSYVEFVYFHLHIFNCLLLSKVSSTKIRKRYTQIFYYFTVTENLKRPGKFRKSICEFSVKCVTFSKRPVKLRVFLHELGSSLPITRAPQITAIYNCM